MLRKEVLFKLKDGRIASLHSPRDEDIAGVIDFLKIVAEETHFLAISPVERKDLTYEKEKKFLDDAKEDPNKIMLICTVDGKVAGNCEMRWQPRVRQKHRGTIGIALISEFWNLGIGTRMFQELEKFAREIGILQLELDFVEGNVRGRALYEKMGFKITALLPRAIRLEDGTFLDEYKMTKFLD